MGMQKDGRIAAINDEMVLNVDGFVFIEPALGLRERAQKFVSSRQWATQSIFLGDQSEPADTEAPESHAGWSISLCLGLDHIPSTEIDWFADVSAIVEFVRAVALDEGCEFIVEFRLTSRLWYSETLDVVSGSPNEVPDLPSIRTMLDHLIRSHRPQRSWWRRWIGL